ncbi:MAG: hypothetical protein Q9170_000174 [Blastenia crenularia]
MSSNFLPPRLGDPYSYTSHYPSSLDQNLEPYQNPPFQNLQGNIHNATVANRYAFNTNQLFNPTNGISGEPNHHHNQRLNNSFAQPQILLEAHDSLPIPQALPGLPSAVSAGQKKGVGSPVSYDKSQITTFTGFDDEVADQAGSDLEEGELSEGNNYKSPSNHALSRPDSARDSPMKANGVRMNDSPSNGQRGSVHMAPHSDKVAQRITKGHQSPMFGAKGMTNRLSDHAPTHAPSNLVNGGPSRDWAGRDRTPPNRLTHMKSLKASQEGAIRAAKQLRVHHIGYVQLLGEHIDSKLLRKLYDNLKSTTSQPNQLRISPASNKAIPESVASLSGHESSTTFIRNVSGQPADTHVTPNSSGSEHVDNTLGLAPSVPQRRREADAAESTTKQPSHMTRSSDEQSPDKISDKSVAVDNPSSQSGMSISHEPAADTSSSKETSSSPAVNSSKPVAALTVHGGPVQPTANLASSKASIPKATTKPVDRKDYIARLLAAKAGKALPATIAPKASPEPVRQSARQSSSVGGEDASSTIDQPGPAQALDKNTPKPVDDSSLVVMTIAAQKSAAAEAKKREQTELARRRIEELRKRSEALKKAPSSTNEAPLSLASQHSLPGQTPTSASLNPTSIQSTRSSYLQTLAQHSYFPLQDATFTIPGLFMSSQHTQPDLQCNALPIALTPGHPKQASPSDSMVMSSSIVDATPQQSVPASDAALIPKQEDNAAAKGPVSESTILRAVSNPRKRPTALDFIESIPSKSRRIGNSKAETSVVFEISDDETDEPVDDISEMHVGGHSVIRPSRVGKPQLPTSDDIEQAHFSPHHVSNELPGKSDIVKATSNMSLQPLQMPTNQNESGGLRSKEEEIARMVRRIAEMEQRRKSKHVASRAQTPGTPGPLTSSIKLGDNDASVPVTAEKMERFSLPPSQSEGGQRLPENYQVSESILHQGSPTKQLTQSIEQAVGTLEEATTIVEGQQQEHRRRRAEIESRIPSMNAVVQDYVAKLRNLQREAADLQAQIQRQVNDKQALQDELDKILQASNSGIEEPGHANGEESTVRGADKSQPPGK